MPTLVQKACYSVYHKALRYGAINRPYYCSRCRRRKKIHGHHKDYNKPLDVSWLCKVCHGQVHSEESHIIINKKMAQIDESNKCADKPKDKWLTSKQIAEKLGMKTCQVRYYLSSLRRGKYINFSQFGTTYAYPQKAIQKVKEYNEKD